MPHESLLVSVLSEMTGKCHISAFTNQQKSQTEDMKQTAREDNAVKRFLSCNIPKSNIAGVSQHCSVVARETLKPIPGGSGGSDGAVDLS